ncbi:MAG: hypothetical protein AAF224_03005 [Pseudomonadota bacterium]
MKSAIALLISLSVFAASADASPLPSQVKSAAFLHVVAKRGLECERLRPWQATAIKALAHKDMERWSAERRAALQPEIDRLDGETDCDTEAIKVWIDAAERGFESEMLPPYLVVYRAMAQRATPPKAFSAVALRTDYTAAIAAIDAKLAALEAAGVKPEGGKPWPEYIARTERFAEEFANALAEPAANASAEGNNAAKTPPDLAASYLAQSALVVEQWLADTE